MTRQKSQDDPVQRLVQALQNTYRIHPIPQESHRKLLELMERTQEPVNRELEDDAAFFRDNPGRTHRVRHAFPCEDQQLRTIDLLANEGEHFQEEEEILVLIRQVAPGFRMRLPTVLPRGQSRTPAQLRSLDDRRAARMFRAAERRHLRNTPPPPGTAAGRDQGI